MDSGLNRRQSSLPAQSISCESTSQPCIAVRGCRASASHPLPLQIESAALLRLRQDPWGQLQRFEALCHDPMNTNGLARHTSKQAATIEQATEAVCIPPLASMPAGCTLPRAGIYQNRPSCRTCLSADMARVALMRGRPFRPLACIRLFQDGPSTVTYPSLLAVNGSLPASPASHLAVIRSCRATRYFLTIDRSSLLPCSSTRLPQ